MKLSKNFELSEFVTSQTAVKMGLDNTPTPKAVASIKYLVENLLQPLRDIFSEPMKINSGYRSQLLNSAVGGVSNSHHTTGEAADVSCSSAERLLSVLKSSGLPFDQAILYPTFLHLSLRRFANRGEVIVKLLLLFSLFSPSCSKPIYLQGKTEYKERVVVRDTTIYIEIKSQRVDVVTCDSSFLEVELASSLAFVDSLGELHHNIVQKGQKIESRIEYVEKIVTIRDSIPYPQIVTQVKEVKSNKPTFWWWIVLAAIAVVVWRVARLFKI